MCPWTPTKHDGFPSEMLVYRQRRRRRRRRGRREERWERWCLYDIIWSGLGGPHGMGLFIEKS